jgi:hypothetical protein
VSGENKTLHHLGENGSELKLTDFQKKSSRPKSSILSPRLALWEVRAIDHSYTNSSESHFGESTHARCPIHQEKPGFKHLSQYPAELPNRDGQHPFPHAQHTNIRKGQRGFAKSISTWI